MNRRPSIMLGMIAVLAGILPASAGARGGEGAESGVLTFVVKGTNGFEMSALASPPPPGIEADEGELGLFLRRGERAGVSYAVADATVTPKKIEADLGGLGKIALTRASTGTSRMVHSACQPDHRGREQEFHYRGKVEFHGEEGFTEVDADGARGALIPFCGIPEGGTVPDKTLPGARLAVEREAGEAFQTSFSAVQERPGAKTFIGAEVMEVKHGMEIHRFVGGRAPANVLRFDRKLRTATVRPTGPFSGFGHFRARPGALERAPGVWTGDLTVDLPGHADLPVTGPGFRAILEHPSR